MQKQLDAFFSFIFVGNAAFLLFQHILQGLGQEWKDHSLSDAGKPLQSSSFLKIYLNFFPFFP
jgi:hypothetical protein